MKFAVFEIIFLFLAFFIAFSILGMEGVINSVIGVVASVIIIVLITLAVKKLITKKKISFLMEYLALIIVLFLFLFIQFETGGIQSIISTCLGSFLALAILMFFIARIEFFKLDLFFFKRKKSKYMKSLNNILFQEKELAVLFFILFLLSFTVFSTYIFWGMADWYYVLISPLFFVMGLVLFIALDAQFYNRKKQTLLNNFETLFSRHKITFNITIGVLLSLFLILVALSLVNEFQFSISSRPVYPRQIGEVELMPFPDGAKTAAIFTNDDAGVLFTEPSEFKHIIDVHIANDISGTFFVVASGIETNDEWADLINYALGNNQNIEFHSYAHNLFEYGSTFYFINSPSYEKQKEIFDKSLKILKEKLDLEPKGFRPTIWADNKYTLQILNEKGFGFLSDKALLFTPRFPYYRAVEGKISNILIIPASIEFNFIFGPGIFKQALVDFNRYVIYLLIEKHKDRSIPFVLVTHTGRFDNEYVFECLDKIMKMVNDDPDVFVMNMRDYAEWVKAYEKVEVEDTGNEILIKNGMPGLVARYKGKEYEITNTTGFAIPKNG
ncbi:polysaccharide deacetylase family protein [Candidatus Woesearchaeota archaeon]|nr:polysaccharide deacetylase family protein [Candidatus Woesearchaeota archaeon]